MLGRWVSLGLAAALMAVSGCNGTEGLQGVIGQKGDKGETGAKGDRGEPGPMGSQGPMGGPGAAGESVVIVELTVGDSNCPHGGASFSVGGATRYACNGANGDQGVQGFQGVQGLQGAQGDSVTLTELLVGDANCTGGGVALTVGSDVKYVCDGEMGPAGAKGEAGAVGATGETGAVGAAGQSVVSTALSAGDSHCPMGGVMLSAGASDTYVCNGSDGASGATGPKGETGATGAQGPKGDTGATGPQGLKGDQGATGATGATGPQGPQGPQGPAADTSLLQARVNGTCAAGSMIQSIAANGTVTCAKDIRFGDGLSTPSPAISGGSVDCLLGEIRLFAGNFNPDGWLFADGAVLSIAQNAALFSILGTRYGGNGSTNFALPDLRNATPKSANGPSAQYMVCAIGIYPMRP